MLERHTTAGRLKLDEFDQLVTTTLHATTLDDLAAVTQELPEERPVLPYLEDRPLARRMRVALWAAVAALAVVGLVVAVMR